MRIEHLCKIIKQTFTGVYQTNSRALPALKSAGYTAANTCDNNCDFSFNSLEGTRGGIVSREINDSSASETGTNRAEKPDGDSRFF